MVNSSAKAENEINERGYFWWSDETIPEGAIAPSGGVNGLLTITNNGRTTLNLDGLLPTEKSMLFAPGRPTNRNISGILLSDSRSVLLCDPHNNGGRIGMLSHENFSAEYCLISPETLIDVKDRRSFYGMDIDLSNFQDWIRKSSITAKRTNKSTTIKYIQKKSLLFKTKGGTFEIKFCLGDGSALRGNKVLLRESTHMVCKSKYTTLKSIIDEFQSFEDLFLILSGQEHTLPYPSIFLNKKSAGARLYFQRWDRLSKEFNLHQCWLRFPDISGEFRTLIDTWRERRNVLGPGIYMYLGTRRGLKSYVENDFGNMISGLESFHRSLNGTQENSKVKEKIDRIINQINMNKDRNWLSDRLKHAAEPSLKERLIDLFKTLPLPIPNVNLEQFCTTCAGYRNGLFHFGTSRDQLSYEEFTLKLHKINRALSVLYHFKILQEIGISDELLRWVFGDGFQSYMIKTYLWEVDLLPDDPQEAVRARMEKQRKTINDAMKKNANESDC